MKKSSILKPIRFFVLLALCLGHATAAPYGPDGRETSWVQPSGATLKLRVFGDDYYGRTETADGHTVIYKSGENAYYYATVAKDGATLEASDTLAELPAPAGKAKHLSPTAARIRGIVAGNRAKFDGARQQRWNKRLEATRAMRAAGNGAALKGAAAEEAKIQAAPVTGNKRGLTILAQFPNDPKTGGSDPVDFPVSRAKIVRFCNEVGYNEDGNTGSVRDYFFDQSVGKVTYTQTVTTIVTLPQPRNYYNYSDYPANRQVRPDAGVSGRLLLTDAINVLMSQGFDFSGLTTDDFDQAIATNIFFAGQDSGVFAQGLWPHQYNLAAGINVGTAAAPLYIYNYQITNAPNDRPVIGTFCHENGHLLLDLPDIYGFFGEGVGEHCLMGSGNYLNDGKTPSPINAHLKDLVGWANVVEIAPTDFVSTSLRTTGNNAYRIRNPTVATESFVVENRGSGDKWAKFSDDKGIAIWHIDETIEGNLDTTTHYGIALMQADGRADLENAVNRGDTLDLFDLESPRFNDNTNPNARWWNASRSGVRVEVLTAVGSSTEVAFGTLPANTILVDSPDGGEVIFPVSNYEIQWRANITGNVKIDLYKNGEFNSVIAANEPDDGEYIWDVPGTLKAANNYTIRISTTTNPVLVSDTSDAPFAISDATFPVNNVKPQGWFKPDSANSTWKVTDSTAYEGTHSLTAGKPGDGKTSAIAYRTVFKGGNVSFYMKVSSEKGFDFGRFYIDGVRQVFEKDGGTTGLSGQTGWVFATFPVGAGKHTLMWSYEKDDSYASLKDTAWLDGVTLPETTQEIAVFSPNGDRLVDGASTITFPAVLTDDSGNPKTFTIKNGGRSDLTGIEIIKGGNNPQDFTVRRLKKTTVPAGDTTTFQVVFNPTLIGTRTALIRILSNDFDEGEFEINLRGKGLGVPKIAVSQPAENRLEDSGKAVPFGIAIIGSDGNTKTFKVENRGTDVLERLEVEKSGKNRKDFRVGDLGVTSLAPGASTIFKVTFKPSARDERTAELHILSNDKRSGPFDIKLTGNGAPRQKAASSPLAAAFAGPVNGAAGGSPSVTTTEVVDGLKYLALTVTRQSAAEGSGTVEVSSNLLDWYSGKKHTTVLIDSATTLKVRDNTPVSPESKRYIRLK